MLAPQLAELKQQALAHHQAGRLAQAATLYQQVLEQSPADVDALHLLGLLAQQSGNSALALQLVGEALQHDPRFARGYNTLGCILRDLAQTADAESCFRAALEIRPEYAEARNNLAAVLLDAGRAADALQQSTQALASTANSPEILYNRGNIFKELARFDEAAACFEQVLALQPGFAPAVGNLSVVSLIRGDYARGLQLYEERWQSFVGGAQLQRYSYLPRWQGEPGRGRKLLLWTEQGLGDSLQMARFLPQVLAAGFGEVVLECEPALLNLLRASFPQVIVRAHGQGQPASTAVQCPLMSLPFLFGTTVQTVPAPFAYLAIPAEARARWQGSLAAATGRRIGVVWRSGKWGDGREQQRKSLSVEQLSALQTLPGIRWFSLQKDDTAASWMTDLAPRLSDLAETAAAIAELDLVISVDTAVAHLAGALGKPVWLMLKFDSGNFWLSGRQDSPWYPSMRIFRQPAPGDWAGVLEQIKTALAG